MATYRLGWFVIALVLIATSASPARAHCQIPCGIYDDEARLDLMLEHVVTIEKSIKQIQAIEAGEKPDWNQLVRWVGNKDDHADAFTEIVTYYFMAQRIKPPVHDDEKAGKRYAIELSMLHRMVIHAMKAKQTTDLAHASALRELIGKFRLSYLGE
jgi:nickel superoxide dismutase